MKDFIKKNKFNIIIFIIPFIALLTMLMIYYPGIYNFDVYEQLRQITQSDYNSAHPFISTLYLYIFHGIIKFKAALPIFQILWFSTLWMLICKYNRKTDNKKTIIMQILLTLFISINPLFLTTIISNNKDTLFMLIFITICYILEKIFDNKFKVNNKEYILLAFFLILFQNIRHNGYYVNLVFIPVFLILMVKTLFKDNKKAIIVFCISLVCFNIAFKIPAKLFKVVSNDETSVGVGTMKALQLEGYLYNNKILTDKEVKTLSKYIDMKSLSEVSYNYTFMDPIMGVKKTKYYKKHDMDFVKDSIKIALNHKKSSIKFYLISCPIVWRPVLPEGSMTNYIWIWNDMPNKPKGYDFTNKNSKMFKFINTKLTKSTSHKLFVAIFYSPATYMYIALALLIYMIYRNRKYKWTIVIALFNMINVLLISLSIPVQDTRYLINNFGLAYILCAIALGIISNENIKEKKTLKK